MKSLKFLRIPIPIMIIMLMLSSFTPVQAAKPGFFPWQIDDTLSLPNPCGFVITDHLYGTASWNEFYNQAGQLIRVAAMWTQVDETWSAHGKSLVVKVNGSGHAWLAKDFQSYIVTWAGPNLFITVPGYGHVYGSAGNVTSQYSWPDMETYIRTIRDVGNPFIENWGPICAYLGS